MLRLLRVFYNQQSMHRQHVRLSTTPRVLQHPEPTCHAVCAAAKQSLASLLKLALLGFARSLCG